MSALVNNLLDMARIQSGDVKLRRQWLPFEEVVGSALKSAQAALTRHRVEIALSPNLPLVEFDATLIERVLYNLLENAAKYTPEGTVVKLTAEVSGRDLLVTVSDNGPGVPRGQEDAHLREVHARHARVDNAGGRARARDQPGHRRRTSRTDLGSEQPGRWGAVLVHAPARYPTSGSRGIGRATNNLSHARLRVTQSRLDVMAGPRFNSPVPRQGRFQR